MEHSKKALLTKMIIGCVAFVVAIVLIIVSLTIKRPVVTFVNDDGTVIAEVKTAVGKTAESPDTKSLKSATISKKGYNTVFAKWEPSIENIQEDITVKATYNLIPYVYNITFDTQGGSFDESIELPKTYTIENNIELPVPTREDCTFIGWVDSSNNEVITSIAKGSIGAKKLVAKWDAPTYKVTYYLNGGQCDELVEAYSVLDVLTLPTPTKDGMVFTGWYTSLAMDESSKITEIKNMSGDLDLYAEWSYNVQYELNGGFNDLLVKTTYNPQKGLDLPIPEYIGYQFVGWFLDENFTQKISKIEKNTKNDITVYAKWQTVEEGVVFTENGLKYVFFGSYAQSVVTDETIIEELNKLADKTKSTETLELNNKKYVKYVSQVKSTNYQFNYATSYTSENVKTIKKGTTYYFNVDPIKWRVLNEDDDKMLLLSEYILDASTYGTDNNYETSKIRTWLNETFFTTAFDEEQQKRIVKSKIDNSQNSTYSLTNPNDFKETQDYVFLLSYADVTNALYGFRSSYDVTDEKKNAKTSEYIRAKGISMTIIYANYGSADWMLRSAFSNKTSISIIKGYIRLLTQKYGVIERSASASDTYGVRPAIYIEK